MLEIVNKFFIVVVVIIKKKITLLLFQKSLFFLHDSHAMPLWYRVSETLNLTNSRSILIWSLNVDEDTNNNLNLILEVKLYTL